MSRRNNRLSTLVESNLSTQPIRRSTRNSTGNRKNQISNAYYSQASLYSSQPSYCSTSDNVSIENDSGIEYNLQESNRENDEKRNGNAEMVQNILRTENITISHLTPDEEAKCRQAAEHYISNCKYYHIPVDPSVVTALLTGWKVLQPSTRFGEGSLLPLKNILENNDTITKLNLSNVGMQDARYQLLSSLSPFLTRVSLITVISLSLLSDFLSSLVGFVKQEMVMQMQEF
jgi:hypothetical protein